VHALAVKASVRALVEIGPAQSQMWRIPVKSEMRQGLPEPN